MTDRITTIQNQLLVMDAQEGSRVALEELVRRWYPRLWRHARRLTSDPQAAWDITQRSWYDIIRDLHQLDDPARFQAWIYKITTHRAMDWLRTRQRQQYVPLSAVEPPCDVEDDSSEVREALLQLKQSSRVVLTLHYWERLSIAEISIVLEIPAGTVKSRLYKAREELKALWGHTS
jgi:RNA polymerase sigma factor (sigma-70 family)